MYLQQFICSAYTIYGISKSKTIFWDIKSKYNLICEVDKGLKENIGIAAEFRRKQRNSPSTIFKKIGMIFLKPMGQHLSRH